MKLISLIIILCSLTSSYAKIYSVCELTKELYDIHQVNIDEIHYHLCIAEYLSNFNTRSSHGRQYFGLYKVASETHCNMQNAGGLCEVKCDSMENDDISDDVKCANIILHSSGISSWGLINKICEKYYKKVTMCLAKNANENYKNLETPEIKVEK